MNILAIRSLDLNDPVPLLGRKVEVKSLDGTPIPEYRLTGTPEIVQRPDGKLETQIEVKHGAASTPQTSVKTRYAGKFL